jgi:hypothetical protein
MASQNDRSKAAIRTILSQMGEASYPDIALRGGEGLASPLLEMVQAGEVERTPPPEASTGSTVYRLKV